MQQTSLQDRKQADTRFFVNWQILVLDLPRRHSGRVHFGHSLSGILGICLESADVQTLLKCICITKPATMTSNVPVMGAQKNSVGIQNVGYCLSCVTCMCVLVCKRACARVFVDNDEWALHQSNLLRRLHKGTTNHFGKHVSEEGFPCQMLSWAGAARFSHIASVEAYLQMMFINTFSQFNWGQFNTFLKISTYCLQVQMFSSRKSIQYLKQWYSITVQLTALCSFRVENVNVLLTMILATWDAVQQERQMIPVLFKRYH